MTNTQIMMGAKLATINVQTRHKKYSLP